MTRAIIRRLANLSLQDYKWRSDYFKKSEADRRVEESLARMIGDDPSYFRPMDASDSTIGPLVRLNSYLFPTFHYYDYDPLKLTHFYEIHIYHKHKCPF